MVIIFLDDAVADDELVNLERQLSVFDADLVRMNELIKNSTDPETDGLLDKGEYLIGSGFVTIQRYLTATHTNLNCDRWRALALPPFINPGVTFAQALNAGANYWKHSEEWFEQHNFKKQPLMPNAMKTIELIEFVTQEMHYVCSNMLSAMLMGNELKLSHLIGHLIEWRNNVIKTVATDK